MKEALRQLLSDSERYLIMVKRSRTSWETGQLQEQSLTLFENDSIELTNSLDPRLLKSRRVVIVLSDKDRGVLQVNITDRTWEVLQESPSIRQRLISFNSHLIEGGRTRLISVGSAVSTLLFPIWASLVAYFVWSIEDPKSRNYFFGRKTCPSYCLREGIQSPSHTTMVEQFYSHDGYSVASIHYIDPNYHCDYRDIWRPKDLAGITNSRISCYRPL
jgi:hypothetical protein